MVNVGGCVALHTEFSHGVVDGLSGALLDTKKNPTVVRSNSLSLLLYALVSFSLYKRRRLSISCSICVLSSIGTSLPIAVLDHSFDLVLLHLTNHQICVQ